MAIRLDGRDARIIVCGILFGVIGAMAAAHVGVFAPIGYLLGVLVGVVFALWATRPTAPRQRADADPNEQ